MPKVKHNAGTIGVKHAALRIKAAGTDDGLPEGAFTGYVSVFGNVDSYGDIVEPGAFTDTLEEWRAKGDPIPLLWGHDMYDPFSNIGGVDPHKAVEDEKGLLVEGELDMTNPTAAQVYKLIKGRRVTDMSFAYTVHEETKSDDGNHLRKLGVFEFSIVPVGANSETDILTVKSRLSELAMKAGRVLSAANETKLTEATGAIQAAAAAIEDVLASVANGSSANMNPTGTGNAPDSPADGKASGTPEGKSEADEEPSESSVKSGTEDEDRKAAPSVETYAAIFAVHAYNSVD